LVKANGFSGYSDTAHTFLVLPQLEGFGSEMQKVFEVSFQVPFDLVF